MPEGWEGAERQLRVGLLPRGGCTSNMRFADLDVLHTHSPVSFRTIYLEAMSSYRVHCVDLNANFTQVLPKVWWRRYWSLSCSQQQYL